MSRPCSLDGCLTLQRRTEGMPNIEIVCYSILSAARDIILGALLICMREMQRNGVCNAGPI